MKSTQQFKMRNVLFAFLTIFCVVNQPLNAIALSEEELEKFSNNNIMFYDPDDNCQDPTGKTCVAPSGDKITWIGDSLTALATKERFEKYFSGADYGPSYNDNSSYVRSGKTITVDKTEGGGPSGLTILQKIVDEGKLRPYLVFALGTNEPWTKSSLDKVLSLAGKTKVILVTAKTINYGDQYHVDYADSNKLIQERASSTDNLTVGDWAGQLSESLFATDGIHYTDEGYDKYFEFIKGLLPKSCDGSLCGETAKERYWSALSRYFGPIGIAGIFGNIENEGGYNPVSYQSCADSPWNFHTNSWNAGWSWDAFFDSEKVTGVGAFQITFDRVKYLHKVAEEEPDLLKYFQEPGTYSFGACGLGLNGAETGGDALMKKIGDTDFNKLLDFEVKFMYSELEGHFKFKLDEYNKITDTEEAAVYFHINYELSANMGESERRERAEAAKANYEKYKDFKCSSSKTAGTNTDFSTTADISNSKSIKYDMTDEQILILTYVAVKFENDEHKYYDVVSELLDYYEKENPHDKGNSDKFFEYWNSGRKYKEELSFTDYITQDTDLATLKVDSEHIEKVRSIVIDGNRTTSSGNISVSDGGNGGDRCKDEKKRKGTARIAETAALMSWPVQLGQGDDAHAGKCFDGSQWVTFDWKAETCFHNPRPLYKEYWDKFHKAYSVFDIYEDCGFFATTVINYLGIGAKGMWSQPYFDEVADAAEDWERVSSGGMSEAELKPGDVLQDDAHIIIYAGSFGGEWGTYAHASRKARVGAIGKSYDPQRWRVFRYTGDKLGSGDVDEENGLTLEQARQFMMNYGANKNDVSRKATGDSQWYISGCHNSPATGQGGSNCVTFSAFFANKFTSVRYGGGDGIQFVNSATGSFTRGTEPKVWAIGSGTGPSSAGHTWAILGHHDGEWIVGNASCSSLGLGAGDATDGCWGASRAGCGAGWVIHSSNIVKAQLNSNAIVYAYPDTVDYDAINTFVETGE